MLSRVSSLVRVDSAWQRLTPSLEVECVSCCCSFVSFGLQGLHILAGPLEDEEEKKGGPASGPRQASVAGGCKYKDLPAANQSCRGLQSQISFSSLVMRSPMG